MTGPRFQTGDLVQRINAAEQIGVVRSGRLHPQAKVFFYEVAFGNGIVALPEEGLRAFEESTSPWNDIEHGSASGASVFRLSMTQNRVTRTPSRIAKSFSSARTQFYPHQFKPLLKLLHSTERRLLIGDDVGLGKTIEAGYILTELEASRSLDHVLVVVPARLRTKWRTELDKRFGQQFTLVSRADIRGAIAQGRTPSGFRWIASYESLRSMTEELESSSLSLDCLIFDEAHRLRTPSTLQHRAGSLLCERSDAVIMLSATPIQTGLGDLFHLARLLLPNEFRDRNLFDDQMADNSALLEALRAMRTISEESGDGLLALQSFDAFLATRSGKTFAGTPVVERTRALLGAGSVTRAELTEIQATLGALSPLSHFFSRTRKVEAIPDTPLRVADWLSVELKGIEKEIYEIIIAACRATASERGWGAEQSLTMIYRAVASCIPAAMRHFHDDLAAKLQIEEEEPGEDGDSPAASIEGASLSQQLRTAIRQALALFDRLGGVDSKLQKMLEVLDDLWSRDREQGLPRRKTIIFSYFRGTVEYVAERLRAKGISAVHVHGGMPSADRPAIVDRFLDEPDVDVLVTSDVSAEGVDLQKACVLFNYDLPWNPMVVEQRIGRIDRIGQEAKVLTIANFVVKDSIEERVLERLFRRVQIFETSIGEMDAILGDATSVERLTQKALLGTLSAEEIEAQLERAETAFENQRRAAAELDRRAGELLAVDQALLDEIRAATGEHQIPSQRQVLAFVNRALQTVGAGVTIPEASLTGTVSIDLRRAFLQKPFEPVAADSDRSAQFMRWAQHDAVKLTFSREVGYRHPNVEIVHATHPLVRWAASGTKAQAGAYALRLTHSAVLPPGDYLWALSFLESPGALVALRMVGVFVPIDPTRAAVTLAADVAKVVGELLEQADDVNLPWFGMDAPEAIRASIESARTELDGVAYAHNQRERELHDLRESARASRIRSGYSAAFERARELLGRYLGAQAPRFVVRMQEAKVERARERLEAIDRQPGLRPWREAERTDVAVGFVTVDSGSNGGGR